MFAEVVERQLYYENSERLSILDSDSEVFWNLITMPVPVCDSSGAMVNINVEDILGPLDPNTGAVIEPLSLLHYSVNLNPALRQQIRADIFGYMSQSELKLVTTGGDDVDALPEHSVMRKQYRLRDRTPLPRDTARFSEHPDSVRARSFSNSTTTPKEPNSRTKPSPGSSKRDSRDALGSRLSALGK